MTMEWVLTNTHILVNTVEDDAEAWYFLDRYLTFEDSSHTFYSIGGKAQRSESKTRHLLNHKTKTFPTGLAAVTLRAMATKGFHITIVDKRVRPAVFDQGVDLEWLKTRRLCDDKPFQLTAVLRGVSRTRGILQLPTGAGKTAIACGLMQSIPCKWLVLAPEGDLMYQMASEFTRFTGEECGRLGDGKADLSHRVTVATFQTVYSWLSDPNKKAKINNFLLGIEGVIVDECHQVPSNSYYKVLTILRNAYYRLGLSATPLNRSDQKTLYLLAILGEVIYKVTPRELMDAGWIAEPTCYIVEHGQASMRSTFQQVYQTCVTQSPSRNALLVRMMETSAKPCLVFVRHMSQGASLMKAAKKAGLTSIRFLSGKDSQGVRAQAVADLDNGDLDTVISTKIFQTGTNIVSLASVIRAGGGKSDIESLQSIGRALRVIRGKDGRMIKDTAEVYDILDVDLKQVNPATGRMKNTKVGKWLTPHAKARKAAYIGADYKVVEMKEDEFTLFSARRGSALPGLSPEKKVNDGRE